MDAAVDVNNCLIQIKLPNSVQTWSTCSEIPSYISTMMQVLRKCGTRVKENRSIPQYKCHVVQCTVYTRLKTAGDGIHDMFISPAQGENNIMILYKERYYRAVRGNGYMLITFEHIQYSCIHIEKL